MPELSTLYYGATGVAAFVFVVAAISYIRYSSQVVTIFKKHDPETWQKIMPATPYGLRGSPQRLDAMVIFGSYRDHRIQTIPRSQRRCFARGGHLPYAQ